MGDSHKQGIESDNNILHLNLRILTMEDAAMIDDSIKGIEIDDGDETCSSKERLFPLKNEDEEVPVDMTANCDHRTENLVCDLDELVVKASLRTFTPLTDQFKNEEDNVNANINQKIQTTNSVDRTQSSCNVYAGGPKKNTIDISSYDLNQQLSESREEVITNSVSQKKGIKRANSNSSTTHKLVKRVKITPPTISRSKNQNETNLKLTSTFSSKYKFNNNSTIQCMNSLINRRKIIYKKTQEEREKLAKMENEAFSNIRRQRKKAKRSPRTKKLSSTFSDFHVFNAASNIQCMTSLIQRRKFNFNKKQEELKKCEQDKKHRKHKPKINKRKFKKVRRDQKSKNQNNDVLHNEYKKTPSPQDTNVAYYSSSNFCNKNHDFHQHKECLLNQDTNETKKGTWCVIM